jgi:hypothetical protein
MEELIKQDQFTRMQLDFLHDAHDVLFQSRRTLMFTYVLAYFLEKNHQVTLG